ncbi:hypothetical protein ASE01_20450 [Nocardioides sp. Root190]|nr:hypothetical protein ASE01_20450 [Nocardioides sp. Root190]
MDLQDLQPVVQAHLTTFPRGFFARLGSRFLTRYFRTFLDGPLAVALVVERDRSFGATSSVSWTQCRTASCC